MPDSLREYRCAVHRVLNAKIPDETRRSTIRQVWDFREIGLSKCCFPMQPLCRTTCNHSARSWRWRAIHIRQRWRCRYSVSQARISWKVPYSDSKIQLERIGQRNTSEGIPAASSQYTCGLLVVRQFCSAVRRKRQSHDAREHKQRLCLLHWLMGHRRSFPCLVGMRADARTCGYFHLPRTK